MMKQPPTRSVSRPVFLNLLQIRMPVGAVTSILHRVTGVLLAFGVPFAMFLLWRSLGSEAGFAQVTTLLHTRVVLAIGALMVWALAHHVLAGVRHMLTDIHVGATLYKARGSAWAVNLCAVAIAALAIWAFP